MPSESSPTLAHGVAHSIPLTLVVFKFYLIFSSYLQAERKLKNIELMLTRSRRVKDF